eukprot:GILK01008940.1.p1 GENE.GILK01008940.1~~GILK01008940.1.p1  ORF type:complete len:341 (-),score=38.49 GILK01008940.1:24-1046(-)
MLFWFGRPALPSTCLARCFSSIAMPPPKLSATVIILRRHTPFSEHQEEYKVLLMKRAAKMRVGANMFVFPGGVLDPADSSSRWKALLPETSHVEDEGLTALRITAIRETFEETGVFLSKPNGPDDHLVQLTEDEISTWTARSSADAANFLDLCETKQCHPDVGHLKHWIRFVTPVFESRRFDTEFFLYIAKGEEASVIKHNAESSQHRWVYPHQALELFARKKLFLAPPQWYILKELSLLPKLTEVEAALRHRPPRHIPFQPHFVAPDLKVDENTKITPETLMTLASQHMLTGILPGDAQHPQFAGPAHSRHRFTWGPTGIHFERDPTIDYQHLGKQSKL